MELTQETLETLTHLEEILQKVQQKAQIIDFDAPYIPHHITLGRLKDIDVDIQTLHHLVLPGIIENLEEGMKINTTMPVSKFKQHRNSNNALLPCL